MNPRNLDRKLKDTERQGPRRLAALRDEKPRPTPAPQQPQPKQPRAARWV